MMMKRAAILVSLVLLGGCLELGKIAGGLVLPPRFAEARDRQAEFRLLPISRDRVLGGAGIRLWATVTNPNPFGFTLSTLRGTLFLDDTKTATTDFPLGLTLVAGGESTVPIELSISFAELPGLRDVIRRAIDREPVAYHLDGTIAVQAGQFGTPVFGPMTLLRGTVR